MKSSYFCYKRRHRLFFLKHSSLFSVHRWWISTSPWSLSAALLIQLDQKSTPSAPSSSQSCVVSEEGPRPEVTPQWSVGLKPSTFSSTTWFWSLCTWEFTGLWLWVWNTLTFSAFSRNLREKPTVKSGTWTVQIPEHNFTHFLSSPPPFQVIDLKSKTVKSYDSMGRRHDDICSLLLWVSETFCRKILSNRILFPHADQLRCAHLSDFTLKRSTKQRKAKSWTAPNGALAAWGPLWVQWNQ